MATFNSHVVRFGLFSAVILLLLARPAQSASLGEKTATEDAKAVSLVRSALENELVGQNEERENLLWEAFRQSPESAAVRWHLGQVRSEDKSKWLTPSQVELLAQNDKRLAEYRKHRDAAGSSLADQVALAQWCRRTSSMKKNASTGLWSFNCSRIIPKQSNGSICIHTKGGCSPTNRSYS